MKPSTTIHMGAGHTDLSIKGGAEDLDMDITRATYRQRGEIAAHLCEAYGILPKEGTSKRNGKPKERKHHGKPPSSPGGKNRPHHRRPKVHSQGEQDVRPTEARNGPKKQGRTGRPPRPLPASGHTEQRGAVDGGQRPVCDSVQPPRRRRKRGPRDGNEGAQRS